MKAMEYVLTNAFGGNEFFVELSNLMEKKGFKFHKISKWYVSFKKVGKGKGRQRVEIYWNRHTRNLRYRMFNFPKGYEEVDFTASPERILQVLHRNLPDFHGKEFLSTFLADKGQDMVRSISDDDYLKNLVEYIKEKYSYLKVTQ